MKYLDKESLHSVDGKFGYAFSFEAVCVYDIPNLTIGKAANDCLFVSNYVYEADDQQ